MIWVDIFKVGAEVHRGGHVVEITESFANAMLRNHQQLTKEGAEVVVLKEHERDGWVYGKVHALRVWEDMLQAQMEFYRDSDRMAFNAGMLRRFSPGFALNFEHPHTGELMGPTLLEVSFTAMPFQTNLRPPQVTNPGMQLAFAYSGEILTPLQGEDMKPEETEAANAEAVEPAEGSDDFNVREAFASLTAKLNELESLMKPQNVSPELSDADRVIEQLSQKVADLEDDKTRMELASAGITENVDAFVALKRQSPDVFSFAIEQAGARASVPTIQEPIGQPGVAQTSMDLSADSLIEMAADSGFTYGKGLGLWLAKNYPDRVDEVLAVARD